MVASVKILMNVLKEYTGVIRYAQISLEITPAHAILVTIWRMTNSLVVVCQNLHVLNSMIIEGRVIAPCS